MKLALPSLLSLRAHRVHEEYKEKRKSRSDNNDIPIIHHHQLPSMGTPMHCSVLTTVSTFPQVATARKVRSATTSWMSWRTSTTSWTRLASSLWLRRTSRSPRSTASRPSPRSCSSGTGTLSSTRVSNSLRSYSSGTETLSSIRVTTSPSSCYSGTGILSCIRVNTLMDITWWWMDR